MALQNVGTAPLCCLDRCYPAFLPFIFKDMLKIIGAKSLDILFNAFCQHFVYKQSLYVDIKTKQVMRSVPTNEK